MVLTKVRLDGYRGLENYIEADVKQQQITFLRPITTNGDILPKAQGHAVADAPETM